LLSSADTLYKRSLIFLLKFESNFYTLVSYENGRRMMFGMIFIISDSCADDEDDNESEEGEEEKCDEESQDDGETSQDEVEEVKPFQIGALIEAMKSQKCDNDNDDSVAASDDADNDQVDEKLHDVRPKVFLVCGICLESESSEMDEILECDNCGITVHEGCYGDIDTPDDDESESDAPTEPWFCEPCKAGLTDPPICELCPNVGGIFKLTDTRKWVHLICALYTPFVGFRDVARLQTVVLEDIRSSMWAGRECMYCVDDNFARTGVCISCDAGLCKSAFHVTCGQRNGFLSDIPDKTDSGDTNADLLYAHCKLHSVREEIEQKKRSWLTVQSHVVKFQPNSDPDEKERITDSLTRAKRDFTDYQSSIVQPKPPGKEYPRLLSTCPEACKLLAKKAEILGLLKHPGYNIVAAVTQGKITKHEPNLSAEFVNYFFKREMESKEVTRVLKSAEPHLTKLRREQKVLTKRSEEYHDKLHKVREEKEALIKSCARIYSSLNKLSNRSFKLPDLLRPKTVKENKGKLEEVTKLLNTVVNKCATCKQTTDQHLLAECDTCKLYYHLACLDPPLTRMPKKSGNYLWQCTECDSSDESGSDMDQSDSNTEGIRRNKRRNTREPVKYVPEEPAKSLKAIKRKSDTVGKSATKKAKTNKGSAKKKMSKAEKKKRDKERQKARPSRPKKEKTVIMEKLDDCCICKKSGDAKTLVKCDECKQCYHFQNCLDPPFAKTPKSKFYGWICEECDDTVEETDDDDDDGEDGEAGNDRDKE